MPVRVKICGITSLEDARMAIDAGADALGFVLYPGSPRYVTPADAAEILEALPPFVERVAVLVNPGAGEIKRIESAAGFSSWQLHGAESAEFCASLRPRRIIKALRPPWPSSAEFHFPSAALLLDSPSSAWGGTGRTLDWSLARRFAERVRQPVILSGGLTPENVPEAIERTHPFGVDVASGVELAPGKKDPKRVWEFVRRCKDL
ncbi:phosphoribosylanthranilate isomerase [Methylacidimicrobium sp. B4]|uniref:phosphoribosylanthranilate isomerase n=1 Tax=Methylacidimicrobium sp. B4 TaxID=2796139 RepID=UPI001A900C18|nr:phosphoribosylanthranilate isomerase [Methylacidimicrobium sp. B4]QSR83824.1 phosphoribosylanthranilate isomerase [Methylacidimicrobium sp. B4]